MLVLNNLTFEFGSRALYDNVSWHIKPKEKIGLIGLNGTGKSTLLRLIAGEYTATKGEITKRKDLTIGFLNQDLLSYESDNSILHVAMEAFEKENELQQKINETIEQMHEDHSEKIQHRLYDLQHEFEALDGYNMEYKAERVLEGLGFTTEQLQQSLRTFSGGWRMRVMLAKILLAKPSLLLLDEPTNHLDLPSIEWLEDYLESYTGTVIIVSHDRFFLDRVVEKIVEISNAKFYFYTGHYTDYLEQKAERQELQQNAFKNQQKYIKEQERLIDRFRAKASKATMAQSRIKALERLEKLDDVESEGGEIRVRLTIGKPSGKVVTELQIDSKKYGNNEVISHSHATINRGDKIALIGANGKGKSTMLRIIANTEPFEGKHKTGHNVIHAFYAQHQLEALHLENNLLEELQQSNPEKTDAELRALLGAFLFEGDDVFKKVRVLSGGEKSRVALAKTILMQANFLLLDEPTNHLDIKSVNVLINVMKKYEGTYVVVSHDRFFLSQVANKIWYIDNKELKEYPGTYSEYQMWLDKMEEQRNAKPEKVAEQKPEAKKVQHNAVKNDEDKEKKKAFNKLTNAVKKAEEHLEDLKIQKEKLLIEMSLPENISNHDKMKSLNNLFQLVEVQIKKATNEWEEHYMQLMEVS